MLGSSLQTRGSWDQFISFTCKILCSARLQSKMAGDKSVSSGSSSLFTGVDNCLSASICHYIQLSITNTATASYDSPTKSHCRHFRGGRSDFDLLADYDKSVVLGKLGLLS